MNLTFRKRESFLLRSAIFLAGCCAGALGMYSYDPRRGAARRHRAKDQTVAVVRHAGDRAVRRARDFGWRLRGLAFETKARFGEGRIDDEVLVERVRAQIGRPLRHPRLVEVRARDGAVTLSGYVLRDELEPLLARLARVRGVKSIQNELQVRDSIEGVTGTWKRPGLGPEPLVH